MAGRGMLGYEPEHLSRISLQGQGIHSKLVLFPMGKQTDSSQTASSTLQTDTLVWVGLSSVHTDRNWLLLISQMEATWLHHLKHNFTSKTNIFRNNIVRSSYSLHVQMHVFNYNSFQIWVEIKCTVTKCPHRSQSFLLYQRLPNTGYSKCQITDAVNHSKWKVRIWAKIKQISKLHLLTSLVRLSNICRAPQ